MKNFLIIVLSLIWVSTQAQTKPISIDKYTTNYTFTPLPEETKEVKNNTKPSPKLDSKAEVNAKLDSVNQLNANIKYALGYRIQVYAGASSVEVKKIKEALYLKYGDIDIYQTYKQPDYKVKFGDYQEKLEAYAILKDIQSQFPDARLVQETVNIIRK